MLSIMVQTTAHNCFGYCTIWESKPALKITFSTAMRTCRVSAFSADHSLLSTESTSAADIREHLAALVSFQWYLPSKPPAQNVISADVRLLPAWQCSGTNGISFIEL